MPCVMKRQRAVKGLAHIVNQEVGGKLVRIDNVKAVTDFFNINLKHYKIKWKQKNPKYQKVGQIGIHSHLTKW